MKRFFGGTFVVFMITLAVVIGTRISADAMALLIGIVCGVLASVPTSMILVWMLRQREKQFELQMQAGQLRMGQYPPVVVVNGQHHPNGYGSPPMPMLGNTAQLGSRDFKVIGQENTESMGDMLPSFWEQ
jgi:hypothetical protein